MTITTKTYTVAMTRETSRHITIQAATRGEAVQMAEGKTTDWVRRGGCGDDGASLRGGWILYDADGDEVQHGQAGMD